MGGDELTVKVADDGVRARSSSLVNGLAAEIQTPPKRLRHVSSDDRSSPVIDDTSAIRKQLPSALLSQVLLRSSSRTIDSPADGELLSPGQQMEVWVPDPAAVWVKGFVQKQIGRAQLLVKTEDGAAVKVDMSESGEMFTVNPSVEEDMTSLWYLHEPGILCNLRDRFHADQPYTYVAHLLIAVNPLKPIADPPMDTFKEAKSLPSLSPHQYAIAESSYRALQLPPDVRQNQSVVVSGESGAGKTESAKMLMRYITWRVSHAGVGAIKDDGVSLNDRIVQSNPVLESLGNAKTQRNHNSSRFGKYTRIVFESHGSQLRLLGASIETYLLEKSRLVYQMSNERNYHIFYEMIAGASAEERKQWRLPTPEASHYLNQSGCFEVARHDDPREFDNCRTALRTMAMEAAMQSQLFSCIAGLLHLGNLRFKEGGRASAEGERSRLGVTEPAVLRDAALLFGLEPTDLEAALTMRKMTTTARGQTETFNVNLDAVHCDYTRDALCKAIYSELFEWAVGFINTQLAGEMRDNQQSRAFIGILDIFGFESFQTNSFEQLLINFANEKLQATFNQHVFAAEQELYATEGISWKSVAWPDNSACISLITQKERGVQPGLLHLLDEVGRLPKMSDADFNARIHDAHSGHSCFPRPPPREVKTTFIVRHYAGDVTYSVGGFLDKNNDTVSKDLRELCAGSSVPLLALVFAADDEPTEAPPAGVGARKESSARSSVARDSLASGAARGNLASGTPRGSISGPKASKVYSSVGLKFHRQMIAMVGELNSTRCNFIRCIKPNYQMEPGVFDVHYTVTQLRHTGMLQCCEMLKHGYPTRIAYTEVRARYTAVLPADITRLRLRDRHFAAAILYAFEVPRHLYQLGDTRLFFCAGGVASLDEIRTCDMAVQGPRLVRRVRRWISLRRYKRALSWVCMSNQLLWLLRRVRAQAAWCSAYSVLRIYSRGLRRLFRKAAAGNRATVLQATWRMRGPRKAFLLHAKALYAARAAAKQALLEQEAATSAQAICRGVIERRKLKAEAVAAAEARVRRVKATVLQSLFRGAQGRKERARRLEALLFLLTPNAEVIQAWWRVVRGEKVLRKLRSIVDRYSEGHHALVRELSAMRAVYRERRAQQAAEGGGGAAVDTPRARKGSISAKRFEMWISLKVGLPPETAGVIPAFSGQLVFSARSATLRKAGAYFSAFFSDPANVDQKDDDGHYPVHRSWKHFEAILDYVRDGSCTLPTAYVPKTYDNRPPSTEEQELLEFLREAHFYGVEPLVDMVMPKLLKIKYGENQNLLQLLRDKGLV